MLYVSIDLGPATWHGSVLWWPIWATCLGRAPGCQFEELVLDAVSCSQVAIFGIMFGESPLVDDFSNLAQERAPVTDFHNLALEYPLPI